MITVKRLAWEPLHLSGQSVLVEIILNIVFAQVFLASIQQRHFKYSPDLRTLLYRGPATEHIGSIELTCPSRLRSIPNTPAFRQLYLRYSFKPSPRCFPRLSPPLLVNMIFIMHVAVIYTRGPYRPDLQHTSNSMVEEPATLHCSSITDREWAQAILMPKTTLLSRRTTETEAPLIQ